MKNLPALLLLAFLSFHCRPKKEEVSTSFPAKPHVPASIKTEHENLLNKSLEFTSLKDSAGLAAKKLHELIQHHFKEEEDYVLPQLGLLPLLASGNLPENKEEIIALSKKLQSNLTHLDVEHQMIKAYLDELKQLAAKEHLPLIVEFEAELQSHAGMEEEVFFPTSVLIGEYLKLKLK